MDIEHAWSTDILFGNCILNVIFIFPRTILAFLQLYINYQFSYLAETLAKNWNAMSKYIHSYLNNSNFYLWTVTSCKVDNNEIARKIQNKHGQLVGGLDLYTNNRLIVHKDKNAQSTVGWSQKRIFASSTSLKSFQKPVSSKL